VLGGLLELRPEAVPIEQVDGAPTVRGQRCQRRLQVSCSASGDVALIGVTDGIPIGVDVERIGVETVPMAVGEGWLSPGERMSIDALPVARRPEALTRAWVHKEAVVKGLRVGLRTDLSRIVTPVSDRGRVGAWTVEPISVAAGHVACLALQLASWRVRLLHGAFHELTPGGAG
jgi:4'-phosphopantetheinyl transferase